MTTEPSLRILLVDDEPGIRQGLGDLLRTHGHEVRTADSPNQALDRLRHHPTDLLITDLKMEGQDDGLELVRSAKQVDPDLSAMVVTGYVSLDVALEAIRLGLVDLIEKPFRARRVLEAVTACRPRAAPEIREDGTFSVPLDRAAPNDVASRLGVLLATRGHRNPARAEIQTAAAQTVRALLDRATIQGTLHGRVEATPTEAEIRIEVPAVEFEPGEEGRRLLDLLVDKIRTEREDERTIVTLSRYAARRDPDVCRISPEDAEGDLSDIRARIASSAAGLPVELDLSECEALSAEALRALDDLVGGVRATGRDIDIVHAPLAVRRAAAALGLTLLGAARPEHLIRDTLWS